MALRSGHQLRGAWWAERMLMMRVQVVLKSANKDDSNLAREIHHHRQFIHPHIARLYEIIVTEMLVWLVLEYCPGDELYNYLLQNGPLPPEKVQRIFTQLVGAVAYVHNKSCVHRDLKLENILLDKNENVKLCDFGFTREYEGKSSYLQTFCGTVCYSAPEMLKGEKYAGEKVDVWSLGVILYALLVGELPFDEDDETRTKMKILTDEPKYPDHLSDDVVSLIKQLLSKRPFVRPSLSDILAHPFLAEHAPQQQVILKLQQPAPFTTPLEKNTLERMRSAGVDIDQVIENVLAQRCDSLAGWWTLLIEKEERKEKRRERKRKEKEAEVRNLRRSSAASSRLERIAPTLTEVDEEAEQHVPRMGDPPRGHATPADRERSHTFGKFLQTQACTASQRFYKKATYQSAAACGFKSRSPISQRFWEAQANPQTPPTPDHQPIGHLEALADGFRQACKVAGLERQQQQQLRHGRFSTLGSDFCRRAVEHAWHPCAWRWQMGPSFANAVQPTSKDHDHATEANVVVPITADAPFIVLPTIIGRVARPEVHIVVGLLGAIDAPPPAFALQNILDLINLHHPIRQEPALAAKLGESVTCHADHQRLPLEHQGPGRRSGEIIEEEDEDEIEEVDAFSPLTDPGETEETLEDALRVVSGN
ncbi:hypothetical protein GP486_003655 [Trichoglossum hirsutum]|uniref:Protein kinase domain-containing protein n=1 Tax=Trichoglossum hirsutum TaxID=265104 RepID=A0A9P8RQW6_9PEZI|nr:hypothetical protein GP486_003655 [Trichoglossum hirsutum]